MGWLSGALACCAPLAQYRTDYQLCVSADMGRDCANRAIQEYRPTAGQTPGFSLGFIEFDDQGQLFDRTQMYAVLDYIGRHAAEDDFLAVVYVHGWKHNAHEGDDNIGHFRDALLRLSATEAALSQAQGRSARRVLGLYLGWRGASLSIPVLENLSFWDRKNTAHKVGHGQVTEALIRLDQLRQTRDAESPTGQSRSRLIVVGHSFGGAVLYSALEQILEERFVRTASGAATDADVVGFGNLVVLINPAFEALLYSPLSDMATERASYFASQLPVLAILTSEADDATRVAFPIGRWLATRFEKERTQLRRNPISQQIERIRERDTNITAVGHFAPYRTHMLQATTASDPEAVRARPAGERAQSVLRVAENWESDEPGSQISFPGSLLTRSRDSAGRNPYLVVGVDRALIPDHDRIWDPRIESFVSHLILVSSQSGDLQQRRTERRHASK